jgi:hypothetical protein
MSENAQRAYTYLLEKGVPPIAAAAAVGHFQAESGPDLNTKAVHDEGTGYGIAGWRDPKPGQGRKTALVNFAKENDADPSDLETQLDFFVHEIGTSESGTGKKLWNAGSLEEANDAMFDYERPLKRNTKERLANIQNIYANYSGEEAPKPGGGSYFEDMAPEPDQGIDLDAPEVAFAEYPDMDGGDGESTSDEPEDDDDDDISLAAQAKGWLTGEESTARGSSMGGKIFKMGMALDGAGDDQPMDLTPAGDNMDVPDVIDQGVDIGAYDDYTEDVAYMADGGEVEGDDGFDVNEVLRELGI